MKRRRRRNPKTKIGPLIGGAVVGGVGTVLATMLIGNTKAQALVAGQLVAIPVYLVGGGGVIKARVPQSAFVRGMILGAELGAVGLWVTWPDQPTTPAPAGPTIVPASVGIAIQLQGNPVTVSQFGRYAAVVVTHGVANAATQAQVIAKAESLGFRNITASSSRPAGFPGTATGDWYITATWDPIGVDQPGVGYRPGAPGAQPTSLPRSNGSALAGADVVDAWQLPPS